MITTAYDQLTFYVDPTALLLLGILLLGVVVLISLDFISIKIHPGKPRYK